MSLDKSWPNMFAAPSRKVGYLNMHFFFFLFLFRHKNGGFFFHFDSVEKMCTENEINNFSNMFVDNQLDRIGLVEMNREKECNWPRAKLTTCGLNNKPMHLKWF